LGVAFAFVVLDRLPPHLRPGGLDAFARGGESRFEPVFTGGGFVEKALETSDFRLVRRTPLAPPARTAAAGHAAIPATRRGLGRQRRLAFDACTGEIAHARGSPEAKWSVCHRPTEKWDVCTLVPDV